MAHAVAGDSVQRRQPDDGVPARRYLHGPWTADDRDEHPRGPAKTRRAETRLSVFDQGDEFDQLVFGGNAVDLRTAAHPALGGVAIRVGLYSADDPAPGLRGLVGPVAFHQLVACLRPEPAPRLVDIDGGPGEFGTEHLL